MSERIFSYKELVKVPTVDCGEGLLEVVSCPGLRCLYEKEDMFPYTGNKMFLREGALRKLYSAKELALSKDKRLCIKLVYAYRHPEVQMRYFEEVCRGIESSRTFTDRSELYEQAHLQVAYPSVAGHPTGGAVDVTLIKDDRELDMGCSIADFGKLDLMPVFSDRISARAKNNRLLLRALMMQAGFAPFDGEWWHFSYGDKEWAAYYEREYAIYDALELASGCPENR